MYNVLSTFIFIFKKYAEMLFIANFHKFNVCVYFWIFCLTLAELGNKIGLIVGMTMIYVSWNVCAKRQQC